MNGYFEQDEWMGIANTMKFLNDPWWRVFIPTNLHFSPIGISFWNSMYYIFKLHAEYYHLVQLIVHASVSTLVCILAFRLTKNKTIAVLTGMMFLLNGRAHQGFTHLAIFHSTDTAMFFILLFFIYFTSIKEKVVNIKKACILLLIFLGAVFTREEGFIILPLLAVYVVLLDKNKISKKNIRPAALFVMGVALFVIFRFFTQSLYTEPIPVQYQITGVGAEYNLATIPIKFVVQNLIWSERIAQFFVVNTPGLYPDIEGFFTSHAPIMDAAFFYIFGLLSFSFAVWIWLIKPKNFAPIFTFLLTWIFANAFMLAFVGRHISVVEPRYLYYSAFPVLCLISIFVYFLYVSNSSIKLINMVKKGIAVLIILILLGTSVQEIRFAVNRTERDGLVKRKVFENLLKVHPKLAKNTIFFVKCKTECYRNSELGISPKNVLPFSSGPGMNILITYASLQKEEKEWGPFFSEFFIFYTFSEDYKKIGDRSFGYFVTKDKLEEALIKNKLPKETVIALELNERDYTFRNITPEFIKSLNINR